MLISITASAQYKDVANDSVTLHLDTIAYFPHPIKNTLPSELFIPMDRLSGLTPWMSAPITRPVVHIMPVYGFNGDGSGKFSVDHWDKFFANLLSRNDRNVPGLIDSQVMLLGNTIALGKKRKLYFANGILYGRHYGIWGNMLGMGTREGLIFRPNGYIVLTVWTQEYRSVYAYSPVVYATSGEGTASIRLPASPLMIAYGAQAYFLAGQFWIGIGATFWQQSKPGH